MYKGSILGRSEDAEEKKDTVREDVFVGFLSREEDLRAKRKQESNFERKRDAQDELLEGINMRV